MELTKKQKELCSKILNVIYPERPISRIDIAHKTGITPATVSFLTGIMIDKNLLYELGESHNETIKAGRRKILLDISQKYSFFIGSEISESFYSYVLTDNT
ncbi:MarR family transcriptional regulator, partial [Enterococcus faecalis]|nr:MarR family transcriptional regulator [Enterococcus faecalis]